MEYQAVIKASEDFLPLMWKDLQDTLLSKKQAR